MQVACVGQGVLVWGQIARAEEERIALGASHPAMGGPLHLKGHHLALGIPGPDHDEVSAVTVLGQAHQVPFHLLGVVQPSEGVATSGRAQAPSEADAAFLAQDEHLIALSPHDQADAGVAHQAL